MPLTRTIITDFKAGELDPRLVMRTDAKAYNSGGQQLKNILIRNTGSASRRPGTWKRAALSDETVVRSFEFDEDEKYILAFYNAGLKVYDASGTLIQTFTSQPWTADETKELAIAQAGDVAFITHKDWMCRILTRTSISTFTMETFAFDKAVDDKETYQPYLKFSPASVTLQPSATSGSGITLTASSALFEPEHVGTRFRLYGVEVLVTGYTSSTVVTVTALNTLRTELDPNPIKATDGSTTVRVTHAFHGLATGASVTIAGFANALGLVKANINGARTITVIDDHHYEFTAGAAASDSGDCGGNGMTVTSTAATRQWDEQVFSDVRGYPAAVCFHEDRLVFAGSPDVPNGIWMSNTGQYKVFDVGDGEDDASIQVTAAGSRIPNIRHVLSNRHLQVFSQGAELACRTPNDEALTPANVTIPVQTPYGCAPVAPKVFDGATMFVQASGKAIREYLYEAGQEAYTAVDVSTLSPHVIENPVDLAVVYGSNDRPEQYAFFVNEDGTLAVFHSIRSEGLGAWTPWELASGHLVKSICVLGAKIFLVTQRNGSYFLEELDLDGDLTLDSAVTMSSGSATTSWALGSDYANRTVKVVSNNYYLGSFTANGSGTITLNDAVTQIYAGYDYEVIAKPMPAEVLLNDGPTTGKWKRINSCIIELKDTLNIKINGKRISTRRAGVTIDLSAEPDGLEGKYTQFFLGYQRDAALEITQDEPLRMEIVGLLLEVSL